MRISKKENKYIVTPKRETKEWKEYIKYWGGYWCPYLKYWYFSTREEGKHFLSWVQEHKERYGN